MMVLMKMIIFNFLAKAGTYWVLVTSMLTYTYTLDFWNSFKQNTHEPLYIGVKWKEDWNITQTGAGHQMVIKD